MGILMSALVPHPPIIIPEIAKEERKKVEKTINSLQQVAKEIQEHEPDLLITISPHGAVFSDAISILDQKNLKGDFADFNYPEISLELATNQDFIEQLRENATKAKLELITLTAEQQQEYNLTGKLDHGVLVPLYYLQKAGLNSQVVPITMGMLNYRKLFAFGQVIRQTLSEMDIDAIIVASGDLSHRLKPGAPAGFNPKGEKFDQKLLKLLKQEEYQEILNMDSSLIEKAGECGLRPLIIMLGALEQLNFKSDIKSYEGTFGVGYAVVGFYPKEV